MSRFWDCKTAVRNDACDVTIGFRITSKLIDAHSRPIKPDNGLSVFPRADEQSAFEKLTILAQDALTGVVIVYKSWNYHHTGKITGKELASRKRTQWPTANRLIAKSASLQHNETVYNHALDPFHLAVQFHSLKCWWFNWKTRKL